MPRNTVTPFKILYVIEDLANGGQEKQLFLLLSQLKQSGVQCAIYVNQFEEGQKYVESVRIAQVQIFYTDQRSALDKIRYVRHVISTYKPAIVHSYTFHLNILVWLACLGKTAIPIGALRSLPAYNIQSAGLPRAILNFILPLHTISNNYTGAKELTGKIPGKKIFVVENGIDTSQIIVSGNTKNAIIKTISVGRLSAEKRMDKLIAIIAKLVEKGYPVVHEHWGNGPLKNDLVAKVEQLKLNGHFIFKGETNNIAAELATAVIFIHTSSVEGTPNVILEAMLQGKAVVSSNCGDVSYIIANNEDGMICISDEDSEFVETCISLIENEEKRERIGQKARIKITSKYSVKAYADKTLHTYAEITES